MNNLLEKSSYESDRGELVGKDPRKVTKEEWLDSGVNLTLGMKAIRGKCVDCCCGDTSEVRKCTVVGCPLWPLRMGSVPKGFKLAREV